MVFHDVNFDTKDDQIRQNCSKEPPKSSKCDSVFDTFIIMLGGWKSANNSGLTYYADSWCQIWYQRWPNPPKLQSGTTNANKYGCVLGTLLFNVENWKLVNNSTITYYKTLTEIWGPKGPSEGDEGHQPSLESRKKAPIGCPTF